MKPLLGNKLASLENNLKKIINNVRTDACVIFLHSDTILNVSFNFFLWVLVKAVAEYVFTCKLCNL